MARTLSVGLIQTSYGLDMDDNIARTSKKMSSIVANTSSQLSASSMLR